jgi:hypothetical protein
MYYDSQSLFTSIKKSIYCGMAVGHIETRYYVAMHMARGRMIDVSNITMAGMSADSYTET